MVTRSTRCQCAPADVLEGAAHPEDVRRRARRPSGRVAAPCAAVLANGLDQLFGSRCPRARPCGRSRASTRRAGAPARDYSESRVPARSAPGRSALLIANTSAISMMPALMACTSSPIPGTSTTTVTSRDPRDIHFVLAHADCLHHHDVAARGIEQQDHVRGGPGHAAHPAARRHRADEDAVIRVVPLHADAIAEYRAAADTGWSDRRR